MKTTIAFATLLLVATTGWAQEQQSPEQRAKKRTERLTTVLELTPEQAAKVEALSLKHAQEMESRRQAKEARREAMQTEMKAKREAHEAEMKAILTPEQFTKWQALRSEKPQARAPRRERLQEPVK